MWLLIVLCLWRLVQVSISGQALVFVVRTSSWSIMSRAGLYTYIAFFAAQVPCTLNAAQYIQFPDNCKSWLEQDVVQASLCGTASC